MTNEANAIQSSSTLGSFGTPVVQGNRVAVLVNGQVVGYTETITFGQPTVANQTAHATLPTASDPTSKVTYTLNYGLDGKLQGGTISQTGGLIATQDHRYNVGADGRISAATAGAPLPVEASNIKLPDYSPFAFSDQAGAVLSTVEDFKGGSVVGKLTGFIGNRIDGAALGASALSGDTRGTASEGAAIGGGAAAVAAASPYLASIATLGPVGAGSAIVGTAVLYVGGSAAAKALAQNILNSEPYDGYTYDNGGPTLYRGEMVTREPGWYRSTANPALYQGDRADAATAAQLTARRDLTESVRGQYGEAAAEQVSRMNADQLRNFAAQNPTDPAVASHIVPHFAQLGMPLPADLSSLPLGPTDTQQQGAQDAFVRGEINTANTTAPNGWPLGTRLVNGNSSEIWTASSEPGMVIKTVDVQSGNNITRVTQVVNRANNRVESETVHEGSQQSGPEGYRVVATTDYQSGQRWTLNRDSGQMEQSAVSVYNAASTLPSWSGSNAITVLPGDTVTSIAYRFGMEPKEFGDYLKDAYGPNADLNSITAGAKLPIPPDVYDRTLGAINGLDLPPEPVVGTAPQQPAPATTEPPPDLTPDLTDSQVNDLQETLGLAPAPTPGPGTQYADAGTGGTVTDAGPGGAPYNPPVEAPTPTYTTIRVNNNTTFTVNQDGDIVGETVTGYGGYSKGTDIGGNTSYRDAAGREITQEQYNNNEMLHQAAGAVGVINGVMNLGRWDELSDVGRLSTVVGLYNSANTLAHGNLGPNLGAVSSTIGLAVALDEGNLGGIISNGVILGDIVFDNAISQAIANSAAGQAVGMQAGNVAPVITTLIAISNVETAPAAAFGTIVGQIIGGPVGAAIGNLIGTVVDKLIDDGPDIAVGHVKAGWDDNGNLSYSTLMDQERGASEAQRTMSQMAQGLQDGLARDGRYGLIADALPELVMTREPGGDDKHPYALLWTDDQGQAQQRYYDPNGNKIHHPQTGSPQGPLWTGAQDSYTAEGTQLAQDFVKLAAHYAIAPIADVQAMRHEWVQAIAQAKPLEAQAGELDAQAQPLRPRTYMGNAQGDMVYDPGQDPERLASLEGELKPLQDQAASIRANALARLRERTDEVALGNTEAAQPQSNEPDITAQVLADGSGTLYTMKDGQGNETKLLDANNTREYDGKAEHTHGGVRDPSVATDKTVEAGDEALHSTTGKTIASTTVQTRTTVGAGGARMVGGEDGSGSLPGADAGLVSVCANDSQWARQA